MVKPQQVVCGLLQSVKFVAGDPAMTVAEIDELEDRHGFPFCHSCGTDKDEGECSSRIATAAELKAMLAAKEAE